MRTDLTKKIDQLDKFRRQKPQFSEPEVHELIISISQVAIHLPYNNGMRKETNTVLLGFLFSLPVPEATGSSTKDDIRKLGQTRGPKSASLTH